MLCCKVTGEVIVLTVSKKWLWLYKKEATKASLDIDSSIIPMFVANYLIHKS